jgi:hypothetical protein
LQKRPPPHSLPQLSATLAHTIIKPSGTGSVQLVVGQGSLARVRLGHSAIWLDCPV